MVCSLIWPWMATASSIDEASLARTPPMGWNSWNHFGADVTDADIRHAADALVASGMAAAGYRYVIIDDGWQGQRDAQGAMHPNAKFPDMKALADYVHGKGLKFGIYSSPGPQTCAGYGGSLGHEAQDARTYASWGVDYLKYDLCSFRRSMDGQSDTAQTAMMKAAYRLMRQSLDATGRPIVFALCNYGWGRVWEWGAEVGGNLWRTTDDIQPNYESILFNAGAQQGLERFAGPGHWNDADMLEIGNKGMDSPDMERTHMTLWALLAAPLIAGNDLSKMSADTRDVLTNAEVLAVDQDVRGTPGRRVMQEGPIQIWARTLADGTQAVGIINTLNHSLTAKLDLHALGLSSPVPARDLWQHRDLGSLDSKHVFDVPSLGVVMLKLGASKR
ncbi:glycoside hydrolase family 27 protein [Dyella psychrodurans]|uniref:Alpha-galactosidase n=2 Tax=Dyella psychrodurans TaxID=1927960 RepID=A0A370X4W2_9GAMM|nr:glycoside hydrolase family 27 protein [Dyella psychrodurans]